MNNAAYERGRELVREGTVARWERGRPLGTTAEDEIAEQIAFIADECVPSGLGGDAATDALYQAQLDMRAGIDAERAARRAVRSGR